MEVDRGRAGPTVRIVGDEYGISRVWFLSDVDTTRHAASADVEQRAGKT